MGTDVYSTTRNDDVPIGPRSSRFHAIFGHVASDPACTGHTTQIKTPSFLVRAHVHMYGNANSYVPGSDRAHPPEIHINHGRSTRAPGGRNTTGKQQYAVGTSPGQLCSRLHAQAFHIHTCTKLNKHARSERCN